VVAGKETAQIVFCSRQMTRTSPAAFHKPFAERKNKLLAVSTTRFARRIDGLCVFSDGVIQFQFGLNVSQVRGFCRALKW
jgi:hypothetical protein